MRIHIFRRIGQWSGLMEEWLIFFLGWKCPLARMRQMGCWFHSCGHSSLLVLITLHVGTNLIVILWWKIQLNKATQPQFLFLPISFTTTVGAPKWTNFLPFLFHPFHPLQNHPNQHYLLIQLHKQSPKGTGCHSCSFNVCTMRTNNKNGVIIGWGSPFIYCSWTYPVNISS